MANWYYNNVSGGIFNGPYTYVSGNLTGGTFGNGTLNSFVRNGFPPPIVFKGRQFWIQ